MQPVAILSAMDQESSMVAERISNRVRHEYLGQGFLTGTIAGVEMVTATTGYGKVGAAATTASVLHRFGPRAVVFGGVAGGIRPDINIGDVVVADRLIQHDYDASPIFDPYVIPSLGVAEVASDPDLTNRLLAAAGRYLETRANDEISVPDGLFTLSSVTIHRGLIASGDQFLSGVVEAGNLHQRLPDVLAVEMEGAAVAQVCAERGVPFGVFRLVSDRSDQDAEVDFLSFVASVAAPLTAGIIDEFLSDLDT
jgi:adenosylhomocysteine nucleosidase